MTRILSVVGARPQFVTAAAVTPALRAAGLGEVLVHTGQHYDWAMSAAFFEGLGLPEPDHNLQIGSASHGGQTERMLEALEQVMQHEQPALVVVYSDTNSTLAGSGLTVEDARPALELARGIRAAPLGRPEESHPMAGAPSMTLSHD